MITKRVWASVLMATMVLGLCACGERKAEVVPMPSTEPTAAATPTPTPTTTPGKPKNALEAYQRELEKMLEDYIEQAEAYHYDLNMVGKPEFAVCDVNMDGEPELIIHDEMIYVAGQHTVAFGYDPETGEVIEQGWGTASCRFYTNGTMQDDISHNGPWEGSFWPFTAYRYDEEAKKYVPIAFVDAWAREVIESQREYARAEGEEEEVIENLPRYPQEVDKEGAGFVYYICEAGEDGPRQWGGQDVEAISQSAYDAWYRDVFGLAKEIEVNYCPLTVANVENLYYEGGVMPKVDGDILNEGYDYSMYDWDGDGELKYRGLSQRQNKLMNDLPVDELPRKAAGGEMIRWTREDIWEDTLLPLCYDGKNDFTLYAVVAEDSIPDFEDGGYLGGAGILARQGEDTEYYPIVHEQFWTGSNPLMVVKDFNGDGSDEAAVAFLTGRGTGVSLYVLYIFDLSGGRLYREETVDFSGIDIDVAYDADTKTATLTSGDSVVSVELDFPEDWEFTGVYAGNIVNYRYEDGKLLCELGLDFSGRTVGYLVKATGEVVYQNGKYTLGPLKLEAY